MIIEANTHKINCIKEKKKNDMNDCTYQRYYPKINIFILKNIFNLYKMKNNID